MVAAPVGAGGGLVVNVTGAAGQAISGIPLLLSSGGGSASTDVSGCARWDAVAAGSGYGLTTSVNGYVQPNGEQAVNITGINIAAEETATRSFAYDRAGAVRVTFQERLPGSSGPTDVPAASRPTSATLWNAGATVTRQDTQSTGASGTFAGLYPFQSAYGVYAESCTDSKPADTAPASGRPSAVVPAGGTASTVLELPSLNLKVTNNGSLPTAADNITVRVQTACGAVLQRTVRTTDGLLTSPGVPYATSLTVCASNASGTIRGRTTIANTTYAAPRSTTATELRLRTNGSSCPF
jgi:hypothetical protein